MPNNNPNRDYQYSASTIQTARKLETSHNFEDRIHKDALHDEERMRDPYWRDYGRILYSASFRRLQGKMQMLAYESSRFTRNRLTHSLEVAQSARAIAASLGLRTTFVAEAAALAHDLGNPPFGHRAETILDKIAADIGGFEGNAQTFRILTRLEKKSPTYAGLNLTWRTLLAVVKYYHTRAENPGKFLYDEDHAVIMARLLKTRKKIQPPSIDCQIMDRADELSYAAHDLEDCLSLGYFSVDELLYEFQISNDYRAAHETLNELVSRSREFASKATIYRSSEEFAFLLRKELMSRVVDRLIRTIEYEEIGLTFGQNAILARGLKNITFTLISRRPLVHLYEMMGETIIRGLFEVYTDPHFNRNRRLLPPEYRLGDEPRDHKRNVIDFIAGMMDSFAIEQYERYYGKRALRSLFEAFRDCMPRRPDMHMTVLKRVVKKKRRDPS